MTTIESVRKALMNAVVQMSLIHSRDPRIDTVLQDLEKRQREILDGYNEAIAPSEEP